MRLVFKYQTTSLADLVDTEHLKQLWRPIEVEYFTALVKVTGLKFMRKWAVVRCGRTEYSHSGWTGHTAINMRMQRFDLEGSSQAGRWPDDDLLATLTHELGHRLLANNGIVTEDGTPDENYVTHQWLYLFWYDSWEAAFGQTRADQIAVSQAANSLPDYDRSWRWAMAKSRRQRQELFAYLVEHGHLSD